jgi:1,4-alpha-glucan branching enzyme
MLIKNYSSTGKKCRVTFKLPKEVHAKRAHLCGEFNDWSHTAHPMKRLKDGGFSTTISLDSDREYRFRYLLDGERWENDWEADDYRPNEFQTDDSILKI